MQKIFIIIGFIIGSLSNVMAQGSRASQPNIVLILADDLGYADVGYLGKKPGISTPNIDLLAKNGMAFTNAYAAAPVCSPTRASLLTGKSPAALKLTCHIPGMGMQTYLDKFNKGQKLKEAYFVDRLDSQETTIAQLLQRNGYATGFIGKWHLAGDGSAQSNDGIINPDLLPDKYGFDSNIGGCAYGQPASYFSPYKNGTLPDGPAGEYLTDRLGDEAVRFIVRHKDRPFFLDLSTYTVHTPMQAPEATVAKYKGNKYYAMIEKLDQAVGKVVGKLKELKLMDDTIIIFYSDNGGLQENPPLRERKGSLYEGGIRVPLIISWTNHISAEQISHEPVTTVDFFPTLLEAAQIPLPKEGQLEGQSLWPILSGERTTARQPLYWHFPHHRSGTELAMAAAIREGDWKLIKDFESEELYLFNLKEDVGETKNLQATETNKTKDLLLKLEAWQARVKAEMPEPNTAN
ncbi:arylsulfatase A-like enzyme [Dyadobacter jejuensis]|uniref:Arylsulfatase A-like enzyme n=1 Tax=Dyadobacter jejuensis TaxID=1082580 RepID=A0A316B5H2_9BACT|nr:sulfatase [Dyadobacter jejuensis]PWJ57887.1 arylsulfatase A-like enzyme [Dyadobacter jejuensis]